MKISLALGPRRVLSRQTAWGCFTSNLALPGAGSLAAGRISGYAQLALGLGGMALSILLGIRFVVWYFANWSRLHDPYGDPLTSMGELWLALRWPLLGFGLFALGWLWSLATGLQIVQAAKAAEQKQVPPRLI
jgi:hypothetical protein